MSELHVVFGTGPVGRAIMTELLAQGKSVRMVNRSGIGQFPTGVELISGDASDPAFAIKAAEGASVVYQALNPAYSKWAELFPGLQAGVLAGAEAAGAKLISMENVYMYGSSHGKPLTEDLPYAAQTKKGQVRAQMSRDLIEAHEKGRVRVTMGRASDFYGPGVRDSAMGERIFKPALTGKSAQVLGNPDLPHTYTYVPDIGKALVMLGSSDEALGQTWHIPSTATLSTREFINKIYSITRHPVKLQTMPKFMLRLVGLFMPDAGEVVEMYYEFEEAFIVDHSKFEQAFGNHATSLDDAIRATVDWYRQQG